MGMGSIRVSALSVCATNVAARGPLLGALGSQISELGGLVGKSPRSTAEQSAVSRVVVVTVTTTPINNRREEAESCLFFFVLLFAFLDTLL